MTMDIIARLEKAIKTFNFTNFSYSKLDTPLSLDVYKEWLSQGLNADMEYMLRHLETKASPQKHWPLAKSVIVIAQNYIPHPAPSDFTEPFQEIKIAKYAKGKDYHHWFKESLTELCGNLSQLFPDEEFIPATDTSPLMERNWGYESGMGWFGKNSCLINKNYGSFHFLGEILTSLELSTPLEIHPDMCGTCTRCIDACPTDALLENKKLDANKCISYWTIETRKAPPESLRKKFGTWGFGCDICQDVCPWNTKVFQINNNQKQDLYKLEKEVKWILKQSNKGLLKQLQGGPLLRTGPIGLKKNAIIIAGNYKLTKLYDQISSLIEHRTLGEISRWALAQFEKSDKI